jgi:peptidoglycan/xylan/chitin deacetylase (PgdA/CDA1 family)
MGHNKKTKLLYFLIPVVVAATQLSFVGCASVPAEPIGKPQSEPIKESTVQKRISTPTYSGRPAIIFRMDDVARSLNEDAVERIIRLFGKYNVPVDCGIIPHNNGINSYAIPFLKDYYNAGIVDISIHANQHLNVEFDTAKSGQTYEKLKAGLIAARDQIKQYYGVMPVSFTVPYDFFSQDGYRAVQDAGFKIFSTQKAVEPYPSWLPVDYNGNRAENGMSRLCTVSDVARWDAQKQQWGDILTADPDGELFYSIKWGLDKLGVAIVGIHPQSFVDALGKVNTEKLNQLEAIIKASRERAEITTFDAWYRCSAGNLAIKPFVSGNLIPTYSGGRVVIFRMDDVQKSYNEKAVEELIKVFQQNDIPLDVGVMPFAGAPPNSYDMPFLFRYLNAGLIDVSVHGYANTYNEFNTRFSGRAYEQMDIQDQICFKKTQGSVQYIPVKTTYEELKQGLIRARQEFKQYFGFAPISFTVPNNNFDEEGYRAAQDAGFKVFGSGVWIDALPPVETKIQPVDYFYRGDINGMYRVPTITDLFEWDSSLCNWGPMIRYDDAAETVPSAIYAGLFSYLHIAVLSFHPQSFIDDNGELVQSRIDHLNDLLRYIKSRKSEFGTFTTFRAWYEYISKNP